MAKRKTKKTKTTLTLKKLTKTLSPLTKAALTRILVVVAALGISLTLYNVITKLTK